MSSPAVSFDAPLQQSQTISVPASAPAQSASSPSTGVPAGVTFDSPLQAATAVSVPASSQPVSSTPADTNNPLNIDPNASVATKIERGVNDFGAGIGEQFLNTVNKLDDLTGQHGRLHQLTEQRQAELAHNNAGNPTLREGGKIAETGAEFAGGAEALKAIQGFAMAALSADGLSGLSASEQFLKVHKTIKAIEESPLLTRIVTSVARGAGVGAAQGGVENGGTSGAVEGGLLGAAGGAAEEAVPALVKGAKSAATTVPDRIGNVVHSGAIQDTLQGTVRSAINDAAREAGVPESSATSVHDVAKDVSDSMLQSARKDYGALDQATGGRVQRFTDAIKNVQNKLRDIAGLDPDVEGSYIEKLNNAQDAHDAAMKEAEDAGLPKGLIDRANASFKQSKSMLDLSKQIRASAEGLPEDMAGEAKRPIPYQLNPTKLSPKLQKMIDSGRIQQAIGPERATALRAASNDAQADTATVKAFKTVLKRVGLGAASSVGAAGVGIPVYEILHHLTGE